MVPLLQPVGLGVEEALALMVAEPDTVLVVVGVYEKDAVAVVVAQGLCDAVALPDFTEGVAEPDPVAQAEAEAEPQVEGEAEAVGQPLGVYERDAELVVVPVPHALPDGVPEALEDGEEEALPELDRELAVEGVPVTVPEGDTVSVGLNVKEAVEDAENVGDTVALPLPERLADTVVLTEVVEEGEVLTVEEVDTVAVEDAVAEGVME